MPPAGMSSAHGGADCAVASGGLDSRATDGPNSCSDQATTAGLGEQFLGLAAPSDPNGVTFNKQLDALPSDASTTLVLAVLTPTTAPPLVRRRNSCSWVVSHALNPLHA